MENKQKTFSVVRKFIHRHPHVRISLELLIMFFASILSAFLFFLSKKIFLDPDKVQNEPFIQPFVSGGFSGLSQNLELVFSLINPELFGNSQAQNLIYSISYWVLNIPVVIISFMYIGKRFGFFTLINITATSLFLGLINFDFINPLAKYISCVLQNPDGTYIQAGMLPRVLLGGVFTGLSSGLAFRAGTSAGGIDILTFAISQKHHNNVGKYSVGINSIIIILYSTLSLINQIQNNSMGVPESIGLAISLVIFSVLYQFIVSFIIDFINVRNKKVEIQIISKEESLPDLIIGKFPHSCTILEGTGAYTKEKKLVVLLVVSKIESKKVISFIKEVDENAFINVINITSVTGNFYVRPPR